MWAAGPYVEQVVAMEAKAKEIGKGGELYYLFPSGGQTAPGPSMVRHTAFSHKAVDRSGLTTTRRATNVGSVPLKTARLDDAPKHRMLSSEDRCVAGQAYAQFLSPHDLSAAAKAVQAGQVKAEQMVDSIHTGHHPYYWVRADPSLVSSLHCAAP